MARSVFFSFHYDRDLWRANVVRKSWVTQGREAAGFWDASLWEKAKKEGDDAVKAMIDQGMKGTSATAVLIGAETSGTKWVRYEISQSHKQGKGLLAAYIHKIKDSNGNTDEKGNNWFGEIDRDAGGNPVHFWRLYPTYDYIDDDGYENFGAWVEKGAKTAGK